MPKTPTDPATDECDELPAQCESQCWMQDAEKCSVRCMNCRREVEASLSRIGGRQLRKLRAREECSPEKCVEFLRGIADESLRLHLASMAWWRFSAEKGDGKSFADYDEMIMAYNAGVVGIHARVKVRRFAYEGDPGQLVESTVGRFIFNEGLPQDLGFVDREKDPYSLEVDFLCDKKALGRIIAACFKAHGNTDTALMLDYIKDTGYHYSTLSAVTISISDMEIPAAKATIVAEAENKVDQYEALYRKGLMSDKERYESIISTWRKATDDTADALMDNLGTLNNLYIMARSGARGNKSQISQIGGMRGLMANATGHTVEIPIKANFREGLSILEYFISSNGARKGLTDTALRTADSGYLTRRLVDISHSIIINEEDCGTTEGIEARAFRDGKEEIEKLSLRIAGRYASEDVVDPATGEVLVAANEYISDDMAEKIEKCGIESVKIRSAMTCRAKTGLCAKCYGKNMATGRLVQAGEAVGIIAAQAIGEPGTQLTMRTFHTGGIAGADDITQGLPRVEELFEARKPKRDAILAEIAGTVSIQETKKRRELVITSDEDPKDTKSYQITYGSRLKVGVGDHVEAGDELTEGSVNPHDLLRILGVKAVQEYLLKEVLSVYRLQGVGVSDKHIEIIIRQMLRKVRVEDSGDTDLLTGSLVDIFRFEEANRKAIMEGGTPAIAKRILLGITKASLATESFLSAASFQETTRVLTEAAIRGKIDPLIGLKENVILGKLIPAGTGMKRYKDIEIKDSYSF